MQLTDNELQTLDQLSRIIDSLSRISSYNNASPKLLKESDKVKLLILDKIEVITKRID